MARIGTNSLLIDTQILIWYLSGDSQLSSGAKDVMLSAPGVYVSAATVFEIVIKQMAGKLNAPDNLHEIIPEKGFKLLHVTAEQVNLVKAFQDLSRHDPFDRLLIAQAKAENMQLLTADKQLIKLGHDFIIDATEG